MVDVKNVYENVCFLSAGSFGAVFKARRKDTRSDVALKVVCKTKVNGYNEWDQLILEKSIGMKARLDNENNVLQIFRTFETSKSYVLESELCNYGDLETALRMFKISHIPDVMMKKCVLNIMRGIEYLQKKNIAHRDVKPDNVLVASSGHLKLADFGYCVELGATPKVCIPVGTLGFIAPEVLLAFPSLQSDLFSAGATIYYLRTRRVPYEVYGELDKEMAAAIEQLISKGLPWVNQKDEEVCVSSEENTFVSGLLQKVDDRQTMEKIFSNPYLEELGCSNMSSDFRTPSPFEAYIREVQLQERANTEEGKEKVNLFLDEKINTNTNPLWRKQEELFLG